MSTLHVTSEIGCLREALVHEPGPEVDSMVPAMMGELLFDDILFGESARSEYGQFRRVLQLLGVEVRDARTLLEETLRLDDARDWLLEPLLPHVAPDVRSRLEAATAEDLVGYLTAGMRSGRRQNDIGLDELFDMRPLPNWCFQRDPQVVLGDQVIISAMSTPARWREGLLASAVFRFHPRMANVSVLEDPTQPDTRRATPLGFNRPQFEGGDVLVLSPDVVAVGLSERTSRSGIQQLARILAGMAGGPRWLVVVKLPPRRAYMHLDTLITPIDRDACLMYPPVIDESGSEAARVFEIDLEGDVACWLPREGVLSTLKTHGIDLEPIPCGGDDPLHQQREQWTDGANAFAVAPGLILLYDRNQRTADELARRNFRVLRAEDLLVGRVELGADSGERACVLIPSHEISRARGGPHCLTHPLRRDDLDA